MNTTPAPAMVSDVVWLKTYSRDASGKSVEHLVELHEALLPHIAARLANGGAFQLVFWGQGVVPNVVPQSHAPAQDLGTTAVASAMPPAPRSVTTSTVIDTVLPATGQG